MKKDVAVLCAAKESNYYYIKGLDIYDIKRNAFNFNSSLPIICHPPCAQFGKLRGLSNYNKTHLDLADFCIEKLLINGGILEHPYNSNLIKKVILNYNVIHLKTYLSYFGFDSPKPTSLLFFKNTFYHTSNLRINTFFIDSKFHKLAKKNRSETPILMCQYLVDCIRLSKI